MAAVGQSKYASSVQEWEDNYELIRNLYTTCELKEIKEKMEGYGFYAT